MIVRQNGFRLFFTVAAAIGLFLIAAPWVMGYPLYSRQGALGPGFATLAAGAALFIGSALVLVRPHLPGDEVPGECDSDGPTSLVGRARNVVLNKAFQVFVGVITAVLATPYIGMLEAFAVLALFLLLVIEREKLVTGLVTTVVATLVMYLVFVDGLGIPLPSGVLAQVMP